MSTIITDLSKAVQNGEIERVKELIKQALDKGIKPIEILESGLHPAMEEVGRKFELLEIYLPEMMNAADAMTAGVNILKPHLESGKDEYKKGRIALGTVQGDVHDIGKNIVAIMLEGVGYDVTDLGYDVPVLTFVDRVAELKPDVVGMSALMTSTMVHMPRVINSLSERGLSEKVKVIVGGAPVLPDWAQDIGADGYGDNAAEAINVVKELIE